MSLNDEFWLCTQDISSRWHAIHSYMVALATDLFSNTCIFLICHFLCITLNTSYLKFLLLRGVYIMFCISPGSLNDCSVVFLMMQSARSSRRSKQAKMDDVGEACAFLGMGRPLTRPGPAARPACSGADPVSRPALAGSQAGSLGCRPGLPPGLGRLPGRLARVQTRPNARPWPVSRPACLGT